MEDNRQIVYNGVTCLECGAELVSYHRHDYKTCGCPNSAMVDGGNSYIRAGAVDLANISIFTVFVDEPFTKVRKFAYRGSRGANGDEPLKWITLCDMTDEHLQGVVDYGGEDWHIDLIKKEIQFRKDNKI